MTKKPLLRCDILPAVVVGLLAMPHPGCPAPIRRQHGRFPFPHSAIVSFSAREGWGTAVSTTAILIPATAMVVPTTAILIPATAMLVPTTAMLIPATAMLVPTTAKVIPATAMLIPATAMVVPATTTLIPVGMRALRAVHSPARLEKLTERNGRSSPHSPFITAR